jgi:hypothetical protein
MDREDRDRPKRPSHESTVASGACRFRRYQQEKEQKSLIEGIIKKCEESTYKLGFD